MLVLIAKNTQNQLTKKFEYEKFLHFTFINFIFYRFRTNNL